MEYTTVPMLTYYVFIYLRYDVRVTSQISIPFCDDVRSATPDDATKPYTTNPPELCNTISQISDA